ncbi:hypothetical protein AN960_08150 [Bacillus sp. FJAT-25509]|nr:hypothetical protein AN960_08150 [Bacillus sp. FJAT-25509]
MVMASIANKISATIKNSQICKLIKSKFEKNSKTANICWLLYYNCTKSTKSGLKTGGKTIINFIKKNADS